MDKYFKFFFSEKKVVFSRTSPRLSITPEERLWVQNGANGSVEVEYGSGIEITKSEGGDMVFKDDVTGQKTLAELLDYGTDFFECTVGGAGADYINIYNAVVAGKKRILVISDTVETSNINFHQNSYICGINSLVNIDLGEYTLSGDYIHFQNIKITYSYSSQKELFVSLQTNSLYCQNVYFDNNSTSFLSRVLNTTSSKAEVIFENCTFDLPNASYGLFDLSGDNTQKKCSLKNIIIIGGGTNCLLQSGINQCMVDGIKLLGTFSPANNLFQISNSSINGVFYYGNSNVSLGVGSSSNISNVFSSTGLHINCYQNNTSLTNVRLLSSTSEVKMSQNFANLVNVNSSGKLLIESGASNCQIVNSVFSGSGNRISGNFNKISQVGFNESVNVDGKDNTIALCRVGNSAGGGSNTIIVDALAERTRISNCELDSDIIDNGSDTSADYIIF